MGYQVTGQRGTEDLVNGRWQQLMVVSVQTDDGTTKDFRIPEAQYTPDSVKAIIDEWYERQQAVHAIGQ